MKSLLVALFLSAAGARPPPTTRKRVPLKKLAGPPGATIATAQCPERLQNYVSPDQRAVMNPAVIKGLTPKAERKAARARQCAASEAKLSGRMSRNAPCNCTIFVHLHMRKMAGTTLRILMHSQPGEEWARPAKSSFGTDIEKFTALLLHRYQKTGSLLGQQITPVRNHKDLAANALDLKRRYYLEVHSNIGIVKFNYEIRLLRELAGRAGCQVVTATFLREPLAMLRSEYEYFGVEKEKLGVNFAACRLPTPSPAACVPRLCVRPLAPPPPPPRRAPPRLTTYGACVKMARTRMNGCSPAGPACRRSPRRRASRARHG